MPSLAPQAENSRTFNALRAAWLPLTPEVQEAAPPGGCGQSPPPFIQPPSFPSQHPVCPHAGGQGADAADHLLHP